MFPICDEVSKKKRKTMRWQHQWLQGGRRDIKTISIKKADFLLTNACEDETKKTMDHLGYQIMPGKLSPCEHCAIGKAKKKIISKVSEGEKSKVVNGRVGLDLATLKWKVNGRVVHITNPVWRLVVDHRSSLPFSTFHIKMQWLSQPVSIFTNGNTTRNLRSCSIYISMLHRHVMVLQ